VHSNEDDGINNFNNDDDDNDDNDHNNDDHENDNDAMVMAMMKTSTIDYNSQVVKTIKANASVNCNPGLPTPGEGRGINTF